MCLMLGQLALWYQWRPLHVGEEAVITVHLAKSDGDSLPEIQLAAHPGVTTSAGPVRVPAQRMVCWNVAAVETGCHELAFQIGDQTVTKQIAVSDGFMRTSRKRPEWNLTEVVLHPWEQPFPANCARAVDRSGVS